VGHRRDVRRVPCRGHTKETTPGTLAESDLSELLAAVQAGEMTEKIRTSLAWVLQQLIEAELTATIGAGPDERSDPAPPNATAIGPNW
jgi:hypothetical protein